MNTHLPSNWCKTTIGEAFIITLGQSPPSSTYNDQGDGLPFFQGKAEFGDLFPVTKKWCKSPKKIAQEGDVLLSVRAPVGPTNIAPTKCCIGRGLASIRPVDGIDTKFILYFFRSIERSLAKSGTGTTFGAITGDKLKSLPLPFPPLPEQHRIVAKMEELFTKLDAGVEGLKQVQVQLERCRQSVLKAAVEGRLTAEWREQHKNELEPADELLERIQNEHKVKLGKQYKELIPINVSNLPELPEGWKWASLFQLGDWSGGGTPSKSKKDYWRNGKIPWVSPKDMKVDFIEDTQDHITSVAVENSAAKIIPRNSLLFVTRSGILRHLLPVAINNVDVTVNQDLKVLTPSQYLQPLFLFIVLKAFNRDILHSCSKDGTTVKSVETQLLYNYPIPIPPILEQSKIIEVTDLLLTNIEKLKEVNKSELKRAQSLRQSILKYAFKGKLVPQDPDDESVSVLLKRIKSEKAKQKKSKQLEMY